MNEPQATREELQARQEEEEKRSTWVRRLAIADVALVVPWSVAQIASTFINDAEHPIEPIAGLMALGFMVVHVGGGIAYLLWLRGIIENERAMFGSLFIKQPSAVIWAYVIPFANLVRPYELVKYIHEWSDPSPLPKPRRREIEAQDYRDAPKREARERIVWKLPFPAAAWWIIRCVSTVFDKALPTVEVPIPTEQLAQSHLSVSLLMLLSVSETVLFLLVYRSLSARRTERYRRLIAQHDDLPPPARPPAARRPPSARPPMRRPPPAARRPPSAVRRPPPAVRRPPPADAP